MQHGPMYISKSSQLDRLCDQTRHAPCGAWKQQKRQLAAEAKYRRQVIVLFGLYALRRVCRRWVLEPASVRRMNVSSQLLWQLVKKQNVFLHKGLNGSQFSSEPGNLYNRHSYKYSGASYICMSCPAAQSGIGLDAHPNCFSNYCRAVRLYQCFGIFSQFYMHSMTPAWSLMISGGL